MKTKVTSAFTLVELSIVLVIIGLIVGGVVGGKSLIDSAKIRGIVTEMEKIKVSIKAFSLQYEALPGDLPEAYDYWGDDCGADTIGATDSCSGNGDNKITRNSVAAEKEDTLFWFHLWLADFKPITDFTPNKWAIERGYINDSSVPTGALNSGRYLPRHSGAHNRFIYGTGIWGGVVSPIQSVKIDTKADDGAHDAGLIRASNGLNATSDCITNEDYNKSNTAPVCRLSFYIIE